MSQFPVNEKEEFDYKTTYCLSGLIDIFGLSIANRGHFCINISVFLPDLIWVLLCHLCRTQWS